MIYYEYKLVFSELNYDTCYLKTGECLRQTAHPSRNMLAYNSSGYISNLPAIAGTSEKS